MPNATQSVDNNATSTTIPHHRPSITCKGLRYAIPYDSTTPPIHIKPRFVGQTLDVVLGTMFRRHRGRQPIDEAAAHWHEEIRAGRVEVRRNKTSRDDPWEWRSATVANEGDGDDRSEVTEMVVVEKGMAVRLQRHVHEKVVPDVRPTVLAETEDWIAIDKPAGFSTVDETSTGGVNSLMTLVREEMERSPFNGGVNKGKLGLQPAHRLDKPVSGVLLLGKSPGKAAKLLREIQRAARGDRGVEKVYVARVGRSLASSKLVQAMNALRTNSAPSDDDGGTDLKFPKEITVEAELGWDNRNRRAVVATSQEAAERVIHREASLDGARRSYNRKRKGRGLTTTVDGSTGPEEGGEPGQRSKLKVHTTEFRLLDDDDSSPPSSDRTVLVECRPRTGQRHQIRAHLASIGWPIANDTVYGGTLATAVSSHAPYVDDKVSTLQSALGGPETVREWCTTCRWTLEMLRSAGSATVAGGETGVEGGGEWREGPCVQGGIWLHSHRYVLPEAGIDLVAPLPDWVRRRPENGETAESV